MLKINFMLRSASTDPDALATPKKSAHLLMVGALGVVFGDIGTSPLYAMKVSLAAAGVGSGQALVPALLGVLSLISWALLLVVTVKYVGIVMRADNHGEGGVFALTALLLKQLPSHSPWRWAVTIAGTVGAAMFFGDSMITPAISVLAAAEGLHVIAPALSEHVLWIAVLLIAALFAIERFGTSVVSLLFGPVMLLWFLALGLLGLRELMHRPDILVALNPLIGVEFLLQHPALSLAILGAVVLAITGGEALYADMGHFGRQPIQRAWLFIVFPCLLLNYFGQGALLLDDPAAIDNPFYRLAPEPWMPVLLLLAFLATVIASQAVISGAFSVTHQAVQLGYVPRVGVRHTSAHEIGEVYVSKINIILFVGVITLTLSFRSSENLASAYGISVTGAMAIDTLLAAAVMIWLHRWPKLLALPLFACLFVLDWSFVVANMTKFFEGGWFPLLIALVVLVIMVSWIRGRERLLAALWRKAVPLKDFLVRLDQSPVQRIAGTAIYLVPYDDIIPVTLLNNLQHNKVLHERVLLMQVQILDVPFVDDAERLQLQHLTHGFHSVRVSYGYMQDPDIMRTLAQLRTHEFHFSPKDISFFIGKERLIPHDHRSWHFSLFALMHRNMLAATEYYRIPANHAVEIGGYLEV